MPPQKKPTPKKLQPLLFHKLHGLGNDFVLITRSDLQRAHYPVTRLMRKVTLQKIAHRTEGVGFDQLILFDDRRPEKPSVRFFNADGSEAEMCGNGLRAAAYYYFHKQNNAHTKTSVVIRSNVFAHEVILTPSGEIDCAMGAVPCQALSAASHVVFKKNPPKVVAAVKKVQLLQAYEISVGNPHFVLIVKNLDHESFQTLGAYFETHPYFKNRTNVELVQCEGLAKGASHISLNVRVFERGVGETQACGTGAVASARAALAWLTTQGVLPKMATAPTPHFLVQFLGGQAAVRFEKKQTKDFGYLKASAHYVFGGVLDLPSLT